MERNVVSLETAKKLKAAGFPQKAACAYSPHNGKLSHLDESQTWETWPAAPTAQELAEAALVYI